MEAIAAQRSSQQGSLLRRVGVAVRRLRLRGHPLGRLRPPLALDRARVERHALGLASPVASPARRGGRSAVGAARARARRSPPRLARSDRRELRRPRRVRLRVQSPLDWLPGKPALGLARITRPPARRRDLSRLARAVGRLDAAVTRSAPRSVLPCSRLSSSAATRSAGSGPGFRGTRSSTGSSCSPRRSRCRFCSPLRSRPG